MPLMTFKRLLDGNLGVEFVPMLNMLLSKLQKAFGNVDFEASADLFGGSRENMKMIFYPLQGRPQVRSETGRVKELPAVSAENIVFSASGALGKGGQSIRHVLYIPPEKFKFSDEFKVSDVDKIAWEIEKINSDLKGQGLAGRYVLFAPGRFGTDDRFVGIPAQFDTISAAGAVVELIKDDWKPSEGAHFFQEMVTSGIAYLHVRVDGGPVLNLRKLEADSRPIIQREFVRHYQLPPEKALKLDIDEANNAMLYFPK